MEGNPTEQQVMASLATVQDPDLHKDLVSLGFIENLKISGKDVSFSVILTTPACPMKEKIRQDCYNALQRDIPGIGKINLEFGSRIRRDTRLAGSTNFTFKNVIAVGAGKGGVGKSTVAMNLAVSLAASGASTGVLDADVYGPNLPSMMGIDTAPQQEGELLLPIEKHGIKMMSMGFLVPEDQALVWRGPMIHSAINQLLTQVAWGELDYLVVDLPPGTGDAQMSLAQQLPLTGAVIVTTPQSASVSDTRRGVDAFRKLKVPILGLVENMAGEIFGVGAGENVAKEMDISFLGRLPLDASITASGESGEPFMLQKEKNTVLENFQQLAGNIAAAISILNS